MVSWQCINLAITYKQALFKTIQVDLEVSCRKVTLDVDTGSAVSVLLEKIIWQFFSGVKPKPSSLLRITITVERMHILGTLAVKVCYMS